MTIIQILKALTIATVMFSIDTSKVRADLFTIKSGDVSGRYFYVASELCRIINNERHHTGHRCAVEASAGSVENLVMLKKGDAELAIVQSDVLSSDLKQSDEFAPITFHLYQEALHFFVSKDSGIEFLEDLRGKRVSIGEETSGTRPLVIDLLRYFEIAPSEFSTDLKLSPTQQIEAFCEGELDASFFAAGVPNSLASDILELCGSELRSLDGDPVDNFLARRPDLSGTVVLKSAYSGLSDDVITFGPTALLVVSDAVPTPVVSDLIDILVRNNEKLRARLGIRFDVDQKLPPVPRPRKD